MKRAHLRRAWAVGAWRDSRLLLRVLPEAYFRSDRYFNRRMSKLFEDAHEVPRKRAFTKVRGRMTRREAAELRKRLMTTAEIHIS